MEKLYLAKTLSGPGINGLPNLLHPHVSLSSLCMPSMVADDCCPAVFQRETPSLSRLRLVQTVRGPANAARTKSNRIRVRSTRSQGLAAGTVCR
jgi:hypothetical protein